MQKCTTDVLFCVKKSDEPNRTEIVSIWSFGQYPLQPNVVDLLSIFFRQLSRGIGRFRDLLSAVETRAIQGLKQVTLFELCFFTYLEASMTNTTRKLLSINLADGTVHKGDRL